MTDTPLIRRVVIADHGTRRKHRHRVTVSTETVIEYIGYLPAKWTTHDVAKAIGVSEHAVRTAVQWLSDNRLIRPAGVKDRATANGKPYQVTIYEICPVPDVCDVGLLNKIFLLRM